MTTRSVHLAPVCEFGGCDILGTTREDGYLFCSKHLVEHRLMFPKPKAKGQPGRPLHPCGTVAAYTRHIRNHEKPCADCAYAYSEMQRAKHRRSRLRAGLPEYPPPRTLQPCGTRAAYRRHLRNGEQPCEACLSILKRRAA